MWAYTWECLSLSCVNYYCSNQKKKERELGTFADPTIKTTVNPRVSVVRNRDFQRSTTAIVPTTQIFEAKKRRKKQNTIKPSINRIKNRKTRLEDHTRCDLQKTNTRKLIVEKKKIITGCDFLQSRGGQKRSTYDLSVREGWVLSRLAVCKNLRPTTRRYRHRDLQEKSTETAFLATSGNTWG